MMEYEVSYSTAIAGTFCYILWITVGNGLRFAIIQFERFGGDPKKRSVGNQLISCGCILSIVYCCIAGTIIEIYLVSGPVGHTLAMLTYFLK